ncbi:MAG: radical SAM protein [Cocleimonas sp.]|nr:radical SAM protein [Cocleimonas sp.]
MSKTIPDLNLLAINLTQRCNLACQHCYLDATTLRDKDDSELSTEEVCHLLDDIAVMDHGSLIVLTGGEPLVRRDIEEIIAYGASKQMAMVLGTNGALLTKQRVKTLQQAGLMGAGISLDSLNPDFHDQFRGQKGSWQKTMNGIENCRQAGLSFQLHFSITDGNVDELEDMVEFSRAIEARVLNIFFLVCTGRGESFSNISPLRYERALLDIIKAQEANPDLIIRPRCAPHYKRVAYQISPDSQLNKISGREGDGCIAGIHYARITHDGKVTACPYIDNSVGSIRDDSFRQIWSQAEDFKQLREPTLEGRCGQCEFQQLCGGCRARPLLEGNGLMGGDNFCTYTSKGAAVIQPLQQLDKTICWSDEAQIRLERIPRFIRKMVKKRAETYVAEQGEVEVTTEHLAELSARRFGGKMPRRPF